MSTKHSPAAGPEDIEMPEMNADEKVKSGKKFRWRSKSGAVILAAILILLIAVVLVIVWTAQGNKKPETDPVAVTVGIPISGVKVPEGTTLGVIVTQASGVTPGSQWRATAEGAVIARERLKLGGSALALVLADDRGTASGAVEAVQSLIDQDVAGIIYASSGEHLSDGLAAASAADIPVILPYDGAPLDMTDVWSTAPSDEAIAKELESALVGYTNPLHINAGETLPGDVSITDWVEFPATADTAEFAQEVTRLTGGDLRNGGAYTGGATNEEAELDPVADPADVLVISGPPVSQARAVYALQAQNVSVPILLTPSAISPDFQTTLAEEGGAVSANLRTIGFADPEVVAFTKTPQGRAASAYFAALRQFGEDELIMNLAGDTPFAEVAPSADVRTHDAVLAFAHAASEAGTTDPAKVGEALRGLSMASGDSIAGPDLDFSSPFAAVGDVSVLYATSQRLGLLPPNMTGDASLSLVWFSEPTN